MFVCILKVICSRECLRLYASTVFVCHAWASCFRISSDTIPTGKSYMLIFFTFGGSMPSFLPTWHGNVWHGIVYTQCSTLLICACITLLTCFTCRKQDPYVICHVNHGNKTIQTSRTHTANNHGVNPVWERRLTFKDIPPGAALFFEVRIVCIGHICILNCILLYSASSLDCQEPGHWFHYITLSTCMQKTQLCLLTSQHVHMCEPPSVSHFLISLTATSCEVRNKVTKSHWLPNDVLHAYWSSKLSAMILC